MMIKSCGAVLLELLIAVAIGLSLISAVLAAYYFSSSLALDQENRSYVHRSLSFLEDYLRDRLAFSNIHPFCSGFVPKRESVFIAPSVSPSDATYYHYPYRIHRASSEVVGNDIDVIETTSSSHYLPALGKSLSNLVRGSDVLSISSLQKLTWKITHYGDLVGVDDHRELKGRSDLLLLLTDCEREALVMIEKNGAEFELTPEDKYYISTLFEDKSMVKIYSLNRHLVYLKAENNRRVLIHDHLDGQSFIRTPDILSFNVWFYDVRINQWVREEYSDKEWQSYNAIAVNALGYSDSKSGDEQRKIEAPSLLGIDFVSDSVVLNPRRHHFNALWVIGLYNY